MFYCLSNGIRSEDVKRRPCNGKAFVHMRKNDEVLLHYDSIYPLIKCWLLHCGKLSKIGACLHCPTLRPIQIPIKMACIWLCGGVHTVQRQIQTQIPIRFCTHFTVLASVSVSVSVNTPLDDALFLLEKRCQHSSILLSVHRVEVLTRGLYCWIWPVCAKWIGCRRGGSLLKGNWWQCYRQHWQTRLHSYISSI